VIPRRRDEVGQCRNDPPLHSVGSATLDAASTGMAAGLVEF
jgi:hypothetical protein